MKLPTDYTKLSAPGRRMVRNEYVKRQNNNCYYCGAALQGPPTIKVLKKIVNKRLFPKGFFDWPIHLQHNHKTGMTEGAVHAYCNAVLWEYHGR